MQTRAPVGGISASRYRLETLTIESFKSFHGAVEVPLVSPTASPGQLCAIIGPNGSGKSSIADALLFSFGSGGTDIRAENLSALVNDQEVRDAKAEERAATARVEMVFRSVRHRAHAVRIARTITVSVKGKARSDFQVSYPAAAAAAAAADESMDGGDDDEDDDDSHDTTQPFEPPKTVTRAQFASVLLSIGIDLEIVDSFICKQQSALVATMTGPKLLAFIEKVCGNAKLATAIEEQAKEHAVHAAAASAAHLDAVTVEGSRAALAPARSAFEDYCAKKSQFMEVRCINIIPNRWPS